MITIGSHNTKTSRCRVKHSKGNDQQSEETFNRMRRKKFCEPKSRIDIQSKSATHKNSPTRNNQPSQEIGLWTSTVFKNKCKLATNT